MGLRVSERSADINTVKWNYTGTLYLNIDYLIPSLTSFLLLILNSRPFHWFSFFLNFPCRMMSPLLWLPKILPCIIKASPVSSSIQPSHCLCLCLIGLDSVIQDGQPCQAHIKWFSFVSGFLFTFDSGVQRWQGEALCWLSFVFSWKHLFSELTSILVL